ncbi:MAG TPA: NADH:flavin oxidoreductase/NADH oxidase [Burkholderiales bacterium]|nr:NADH:flavin oxidoreductase/NADH oxidase [Burkholderiales bacterium]
MLFEPLKIRDVSLRNRIVVSPMCQYSAKDGHVGDWHLVHLGKFAQGGAGTVFVEATAVEKRGRITHGDTGIWDDAHIAGLSRIAKFIKEQGAVPAIQLAHAGRKASMARPWYGNGPLTQEDFDRGDKAWSTVAPTEQPIGQEWIAPRAMREGDLQTVTTAYREAVRRATAAGFEMIELHAAHGYLLHTFLSPLSNKGSLEERMRFPLQVVEAVRQAWKKPLFVRVSSIDDLENGWQLEDTLVFARELHRIGVDVVDCSSGGIAGSATAATKTVLPRVPGFQVPFAERIRKDVGIKTMAVGLILTPQQAEEVAGKVDLVAIGREALYDANWPLHAAQALGADPEFARWPVQYGWWLTRREGLLKKLGLRKSNSGPG